MEENNIFLSVVIPAYNEEKRILQTLCLIDKYFTGKGIKYEVVVVDDGSKDNTIRVIENFISGKDNMRLLKNGQNRGKGYAVKKGVLEAKGEYILFSDADLATPIQESEKLISWLGQGYDLVIGSRKMKESNVIAPLHRRFIGVLAFLFISLLGLRQKVYDTQCGFKVFKKEAARYIFSRQILDGGMFDVEIIYIAIKNNFKFKEIPVNWQHKKGSTISIWKCLLFDPLDLIKIKIYYFLRRY